MIIIYLGGIGSGKSLSIIKEIIDSGSFAYANFELKNIENFHRLKISDIISTQTDGKKEIKKVNWGFWESERIKHKNFSIFLDEIHNIIHSRRSMSKTNILMSKWVSQIRKILQDSQTNHLFIISQTIRKIDIDFRELAAIIVECHKIRMGKRIIIKQRYYEGLDNYLFRRAKATRAFIGNKYFKYYDYRNLVTFSDSEEYI